MADRWTPKGIDAKQLREEELILASRLKIVRSLLDALGNGAVTPGMRKRRKRANTRLASIIAVLKNAGRSLPVQAIYRAMQEADPDLKWKDPAAAFRSYLRGQEECPDEVVRTGKNQYGLRAWIDAESKEVRPTGAIPITPQINK